MSTPLDREATRLAQEATKTLNAFPSAAGTALTAGTSCSLCRARFSIDASGLGGTGSEYERRINNRLEQVLFEHLMDEHSEELEQRA